MSLSLLKRLEGCWGARHEVRLAVKKQAAGSVPEHRSMALPGPRQVLGRQRLPTAIRGGPFWVHRTMCDDPSRTDCLPTSEESGTRS